MTVGDLTIERVLHPGPEHVSALARLVPQLSSAVPPSLEDLRRITENPSTHLYVARVDGEIVGSLSLVAFAIPTGLRAWIEDVVVDEGRRGLGIASALVRHAADQAASLGCRDVDLTSRPTRTEANRLYRRLGFKQRSTNVYRLTLSPRP